MLTRVEIENYRSIRRTVLHPSPLCALVGPNNAGKSNILAAIDVVLGRTFPTEGAIQRDDRYGFDQTSFPHILLELEYTGEDTYRHRQEFEFRRVDERVELLDERGDRVRGAERERFSLLRVGVDRRAQQHQPTNRWTLLGRLLLDINEEFRSDPERMRRFDDSLRQLLEQELSDVEGFRELRSILGQEAASQLQRTVEEVSVDFSLRDPWSFYRTLQLVITECGLQTRAEQAGMGLQSSLTIAILRAYARLARPDRAIIAIEEPELFLHPMAARQLYALLRELAYPLAGQSPLQVLYTTHSPAMISAEFFDEIHLVRKERVEGFWTTTVREVSIANVLAELRAEGVPNPTAAGLRGRLAVSVDRTQAEGFFASAVVLVEGPTEALALPEYARSFDVDLDALNIAVVAAHGKGPMAELYRVFSAFGIPCYPIFDADRGKSEADEVANRRLIALVGASLEPFPESTVTDRCAVWERDFEEMLRSAAPEYAGLEAEAGAALGRCGKPPRARFCARRLVERAGVPEIVRQLIERVAGLAPSSP